MSGMNFQILQKKLNLYQFYFSPQNIIETIQNMQIADLNGMCYKSTYTGSQVLTALNMIYPLLGLDKQYYLPKELNKKIRNILG